MNAVAEFLMCIFIVWVIGQAISAVISVKAIKKVEEDLRDHFDKVMHEVKIEKHHNIEYWFDGETNQFLGQGATAEEVTGVLKSRFPDHIFIVPAQGVICAPDWTITKKFDLAEQLKKYANK